jgi:hypothetical protein
MNYNYKQRWFLGVWLRGSDDMKVFGRVGRLFVSVAARDDDDDE